MPYTEERATYDYAFYTSATLVATGNTGIIATPLVTSGGPAIYPLYFLAAGSAMATDETNIITIDWYVNAAGDGGAVGTTTFDQLTAGSPNDLETWPGDVTAYDAARDRVPLFPYHKITWTLAGTTKSMGFIIYMGYTRVGI